MTRIELALATLGTASLLVMASCGGGQKDTQQPTPKLGDGPEASAEPAGSESAGRIEGEGGMGVDRSALAADGTGAAKPSPGASANAPAMSKEEVGERAVAMIQSMADAAEEHKDDCDAMADAMGSIVEVNRDVIAAGKQFDDDPEARKWFEETHGEQLKEIMGQMMPTMMGCSENPKLQKVFQEMQ